MPVLVIDVAAFLAMRPERNALPSQTLETLAIPDFVEWAIFLSNDPTLAAWMQDNGDLLRRTETWFTRAIEARVDAWVQARREPEIDWELICVWAAVALATSVHEGRMASNRYDVLVDQPQALRLLTHIGIRTVTAAEVAGL